jgi:quercetin dioxygenase-like cupin family protein
MKSSVFAKYYALVWAIVASIALVSVAVQSPQAQTQPSPVQPAPVKRTIIGKADVPGANYEVISALVEIAPNFKAGRHFHPGMVHGQVLEGEFWLAVDGESEKTVKAGEALALADRAVHNEGAGANGTKLIAVYVVEKGQALVQPVK